MEMGGVEIRTTTIATIVINTATLMARIFNATIVVFVFRFTQPFSCFVDLPFVLLNLLFRLIHTGGFGLKSL